VIAEKELESYDAFLEERVNVAEEFIEKLKGSDKPSSVKMDKDLEDKLRALISRCPLRLAHSIQDFDIMAHIKKPIAPSNPLVSLPKNHSKKTLFLDLDETLVHVTTDQDKADVILQMDTSPFTHAYIAVIFRPHLQEFLHILKQKYELVLFTSATKPYADPILDYIDPHNQIFAARLYRHNCHKNANSYVKDLRIFLSNGRKLKHFVIVDNSHVAFSFQLENGVPASSFMGDKKDMELKFILHYLLSLPNNMDCRMFNRLNFRLHDLYQLINHQS
jgi:Dullard-like phosphatase family protein